MYNAILIQKVRFIRYYFRFKIFDGSNRIKNLCLEAKIVSNGVHAKINKIKSACKAIFKLIKIRV